MTINVSETPIAAPIKYAEAQAQMRSTRPAPLGAEFAQGINEPEVRVEISDLARQMQQASALRSEALKGGGDLAATRNFREIAVTSLAEGSNSKGVQERQAEAEVNAARVERNDTAEPPKLDLSPRNSILEDAGPSLRRKLELQETSQGLREPLQQPVQLERAPRILSSGVTPEYAMNAYARTGN